MNAIPKPGQVWEHYSGNRFKIVLVANECAAAIEDLAMQLNLPFEAHRRRGGPNE